MWWSWCAWRRASGLVLRWCWGNIQWLTTMVIGKCRLRLRSDWCQNNRVAELPAKWLRQPAVTHLKPDGIVVQQQPFAKQSGAHAGKQWQTVHGLRVRAKQPSGRPPYALPPPKRNPGACFAGAYQPGSLTCLPKSFSGAGYWMGQCGLGHPARISDACWARQQRGRSGLPLRCALQDDQNLRRKCGGVSLDGRTNTSVCLCKAKKRNNGSGLLAAEAPQQPGSGKRALPEDWRGWTSCSTSGRLAARPATSNDIGARGQ